VSVLAGIMFLSQQADEPHPIQKDPNMRLQEGQYETSVPTVSDRVVQAALKLVLEPIFEADFAPVS
jgi:RNA-directed DNA polymerase